MWSGARFEPCTRISTVGRLGEELSAAWAESRGAEVARQTRKAPFDLLVDGRKVEVKTALLSIDTHQPKDSRFTFSHISLDKNDEVWFVGIAPSAIYVWCVPTVDLIALDRTPQTTDAAPNICIRRHKEGMDALGFPAQLLSEDTTWRY